MLKKISALFTVLLLLAGCSHAVRHSTSPELSRLKPYTVAVLPVRWRTNAAKPEVGRVFDRMVAEKIGSLGYGATVVKQDDARLADEKKGPAELAAAFGTDAVLYSDITKWDTNTFVTYAALKVAARFDLYSANGERLWNADYETKYSDIRLDNRPMELAVLDAYEPKVQRFIDIVFTSLPENEPVKSSPKRYFDWLP